MNDSRTWKQDPRQYQRTPTHKPGDLCPNCGQDELGAVYLGAENLMCGWCWDIYTPHGQLVREG